MDIVIRGGDGPAAAPASTPWLNITPQVGLRVAASVSLMTLGLYYLSTGRRDADLSRMILGGLLSIASLLTF